MSLDDSDDTDDKRTHRSVIEALEDARKAVPHSDGKHMYVNNLSRFSQLLRKHANELNIGGFKLKEHAEGHNVLDKERFDAMVAYLNAEFERTKQ